VPDPVVEVHETPHEVAWYSTNDAGGAETNRFQDNGLADALAVTGGMVAIRTTCGSTTWTPSSSQKQLDYLDSSGFVNPVGLPDCELGCNAVPAP
jgi:hypothetical protein